MTRWGSLVRTQHRAPLPFLPARISEAIHFSGMFSVSLGWAEIAALSFIVLFVALVIAMFLTRRGSHNEDDERNPSNNTVQRPALGRMSLHFFRDVWVFQQGGSMMWFDPGVDDQGPLTSPMFVSDERLHTMHVVGRI